MLSNVIRLNANTRCVQSLLLAVTRCYLHRRRNDFIVFSTFALEAGNDTRQMTMSKSIRRSCSSGGAVTFSRGAASPASGVGTVCVRREVAGHCAGTCCVRRAVNPLTSIASCDATQRTCPDTTRLRRLCVVPDSLIIKFNGKLLLSRNMLVSLSSLCNLES